MECIVTADSFEEVVLKNNVPVLVDFYADWCGPCKMMSPVLSGIAEEYEGKLVIAKCNVDENMELAERYNVASIPNMQLFKNGQVAANYIGFMSADALKEKINADL